MTNCLQPPNLFKNLPGWEGMGFADIKNRLMAVLMKFLLKLELVTNLYSVTNL
jgi:hypothetical protein